MKKYFTSVKIWHNYGHECVAPLFCLTLYIVTLNDRDQRVLKYNALPLLTSLVVWSGPESNVAQDIDRADITIWCRNISIQSSKTWVGAIHRLGSVEWGSENWPSFADLFKCHLICWQGALMLGSSESSLVVFTITSRCSTDTEGRLSADTYWLKLTLSTVHQIFRILYSGQGEKQVG